MSMFSQDLLKEVVEVRVEPMSDFIANHLCLKTFSSPLRARARSPLGGPARGRRGRQGEGARREEVFDREHNIFRRKVNEVSSEE